MLMSKCFLAAAVITMYVMQLLIFIPTYCILNSLDGPDFNYPLIGVSMGAALILGLVAFVFAIIGSAKKEPKAYTLSTVIIKTVLIPFFGLNLYLWCVWISGLFNPFLLLAIPVVICIGVCLTYVYMLMTGMPDVIYTIVYLVRNKIRPKFPLVLGIILCFTFVADVAGSVLIHRFFKEQNANLN